MKRLTFLLALAVILLSSLCPASSVNIEAWQNGAAADTLRGASPIALRVYINNTENIKGFTLGFELSGDPGLLWTWGNPKADSADWSNIFNFTGFTTNENAVDGTLPDSILNGGLSLGSIPPGERYYAINGTTNSDPENTLTLCIDSTFIPPYGNFVFVDDFSVSFKPDYLPGDQPLCWPVTAPVYVCGDANGNGGIDLGDAVYLINFIFKGGTAPNPLWTGDANCDGLTNVGDPVYIINYIFKFGPAPCCP